MYKEEGDPCPVEGCKGILVYPPVVNCSCHSSPPCSACVNNRLICPLCGWQEERPYKQEAKQTHVPILDRPRPLDPTKIDYRIKSHTSFSQICEGVYPPGTSSKDVENVVRGTFGGRFERFGDGVFKYIAYTD